MNQIAEQVEDKQLLKLISGIPEWVMEKGAGIESFGGGTVPEVSKPKKNALPVANLSQARSGRRADGNEKWRIAAGQFEYVERTPGNHLGHSWFIGLREDKKAPEVRRET